jgi:deazaflavin-dependent oxidoreductase (nitroreductase family)
MTLAHRYVRPGFAMSRLVNPIMVRLGLTPVLVVRGRRTGALLEVPMGAPLEVDGGRYLVSGRGETHWARNLRAAGEATLRIRGRTERFRAVELKGEERVRIVEAYRAKLGRSVDRYFAEIPSPADHPVFRIDPIG